jgi:hypothetical protein
MELARSQADLRYILLKGDVESNVRDARAGNILDTFLFIPTYTMALLVMGLLVARGSARSGRELFWIVIVVVTVIAVADWTENAGIERTLRHIEIEQGPRLDDASYISYPSMVKWTLIGIVFVVLGVAAMLQSSGETRLFAVVLLVAGCAQLFQMLLYFRERFAETTGL